MPFFFCCISRPRIHKLRTINTINNSPRYLMIPINYLSHLSQAYIWYVTYYTDNFFGLVYNDIAKLATDFGYIAVIASNKIINILYYDKNKNRKILDFLLWFKRIKWSITGKICNSLIFMHTLNLVFFFNFRIDMVWIFSFL